jgi:hypothetical protein
MVYAQRLVREARERAGLGAHVTLDACRHGGMTELGDSGVTEQGGMSLTGHSTPQAFRLYVKRTETQRMIAARQRRAWVDANEPGSQVRITSTKSQLADEVMGAIMRPVTSIVSAWLSVFRRRTHR